MGRPIGDVLGGLLGGIGVVIGHCEFVELVMEGEKALFPLPDRGQGTGLQGGEEEGLAATLQERQGPLERKGREIDPQFRKPGMQSFQEFRGFLGREQGIVAAVQGNIDNAFGRPGEEVLQ
jgi:hypothetical protein